MLKQAKSTDETRTPWKILRIKDKSGGKLSTDCIDILPTLETNDKKHVRDATLCGSATLKRVAKIVECFAETFIPCHISTLEPKHGKGEVTAFDLEKALPVVLRATGLHEAAKERCIKVPQSSDATNIAKNVSFIAHGIKNKDRAAVCPITKRPLCMPAANDGESAKTAVQSYENCTPAKIIIGKETKEVACAQLNDNFKKLAKEDRLSEDNTSSILGEGFKPLVSPCDADKKMHWAGLGSGGAAKVHKLPCTCCAVKSDDLAIPNSTLCERWCQQWENEGKLEEFPNWRCCHKPMVTPERIAAIREQGKQTQLQLGDLAEKLDLLAGLSKIDCSEDPRGVGQGNSIHEVPSIHFDHARGNLTDKNTCLMSLANDLAIRNLDMAGNIKQMQERLTKGLVLEFVLREIEADIAHGTISQRSPLHLTINVIPCILHFLENGVGLKIFTRLLRIGLDKVKEGATLGTGDGEDVRIKAHSEEIQEICNTSSFGSEERPVRWTRPYDTATKKITRICLDNVRTRKAINTMDSLVDASIPEGEGRELWKATTGLHREAMLLLGDAFASEQR
jgi:hypothetical protein